MFSPLFLNRLKTKPQIQDKEVQYERGSNIGRRVT